MPTQYHKIANIMNEKELNHFMSSLKASIANAVEKLPSHADFIQQYCKS